jgi:hypothetical protein
MIKFFQVIFFSAGLIVIVINSLEFSRYSESKKEGNMKPHPIRWFPFITTFLAAIGCVLQILITWINNV